MRQGAESKNNEREDVMAATPRILVVDDELPVCKSVARAVSGEYEVDTALSAEEALLKQAESEYDVIVTDLMMPGQSGMDLLKALNEKGSATKVVMITGYPSVKSAVMSIKLGAFDFIPKPFTPNEIRNLVKRALASGTPESGNGKGVARPVVPPGDIYAISDNSWARIEDNGLARVGVHDSFLKTIKDPASIDMPRPGDMRYQGEACVRLVDGAGNAHRVWTPVSGRVKTVNERLKESISCLLEDPYGDGWVIMLEPTHLEEDLKRLTHQAR